MGLLLSVFLISTSQRAAGNVIQQIKSVALHSITTFTERSFPCQFSGNINDWLLQLQPIPVAVSAGWKLCDYQHDYRIWRNHLHSPLLGGSVTLHACYSKIKGSSQVS